jgi:5-methylcytosine-specific restriction endonuclease McrA
MNHVLVIDTNQQPTTPLHPAAARRLLSSGQAAVWRHYPFTIILNATTPPREEIHPLRLKLDPGSKTTGMALVDDTGGQVVWAAELAHRGQTIRDAVLTRRAVRRSRRQRHTRYRKQRFLNRRRRDGWLPRSLESRVANVETWVRRLTRLVLVGAISMELVRFDTQLMQDAEVSGVAYQQGTPAGYETREYLLEKCGRRCAYCRKENVPLQVEHLIPKARGGSDRVSNLTLACEPCNQRKSNQTATEFGFPQLMAQAKQPLKDAAAINSTRWALYQALGALGLPLEAGTGRRSPSGCCCRTRS